jgi:2-oxoglutarate ferredoxin oxidoreductase subunit alpha
MSKIRGGMNSPQIRISSDRVRSPVLESGIPITLHKGGVKHVEKSVTGKTVILGGVGGVM